MGATYYGTTAASSLANPPNLVARGIGGQANIPSTGCPMGIGLWMYASTNDTTDIYTANYFSDAKALGMRQGDVIIKVGMTSTVASSQVLTMGVIGAVSTDGAACSTMSFMTST